MISTKSLKTLLAAGALALVAGGASAATVTYESAEADPKVRLVIDDSFTDKFRFTLTTAFGSADFLGLGFDFAGSAITQGMISLVSYTPDSSNAPALTLFGNNTNLQMDCGQGCNFEGNGSDSAPYDYIIRIGEQGGNPLNLVSSVVFDIALVGSLAQNPFADFGVRAQGTSGPSSSIKFGLVETAAVPVPAAGFLLIGALGGLAALRRRRRTA